MKHTLESCPTIRTSPLGAQSIACDIIAPFEMPASLMLPANPARGVHLVFAREAVPLDQCALERHDDQLTVHIALDECPYNGTWTLLAAPYDTLLAHSAAPLQEIAA